MWVPVAAPRKSTLTCCFKGAAKPLIPWAPESAHGMALSLNAKALSCRVLPAARTGSVFAPPVSEIVVEGTPTRQAGCGCARFRSARYRSALIRGPRICGPWIRRAVFGGSAGAALPLAAPIPLLGNREGTGWRTVSHGRRKTSALALWAALPRSEAEPVAAGVAGVDAPGQAGQGCAPPFRAARADLGCFRTQSLISNHRSQS